MIRKYWIVMVLLTACATVPDQSNWPQDIPALQFFESYYDKDEANKKVMTKHQYLLWIKRFYFGSILYSRGWKQATAETVATMQTPEEKDLVRKKMEMIGNLVGPEWAKNRAHRVINTRHIMIWGNAVNASVKDGMQINVINAVHDDVNALLSREIAPSVIQSNRYSKSELVLDEELFVDELL